MDSSVLQRIWFVVCLKRPARTAAAGALVLASLAPSGSIAGELWQQDPLINEAITEESGRGTLFRWGIDAAAKGGPNLEEPLVTDRPDFTEASVTVGRGVAQLETGYTYSYNSDGGTRERSHSWGEPLLRYGIFAEWLEFRVATFPTQNSTRTVGVGHAAASSENHVYLGLKFALTPQEKWLPEMALVPQMTIPVQSDAFGNRDVLPGVNWLYGWDVTDKISTGGSTQVNHSLDEGTGEAYAEWAQSWTVGYALAENVGAYTEWFAIIPNAADSARTEHYFDCGLTYLVNNDVQLDVRAGWGLNDAAIDFFVGTGLSIRFQ